MTLKTRSPRSTSPLLSSSDPDSSRHEPSSTSNGTDDTLEAREGNNTVFNMERLASLSPSRRYKGHPQPPRRVALYHLLLGTVVVVGVILFGVSVSHSAAAATGYLGDPRAVEAPPPPPREIYDTIIVGAGWSGLSAAAHLYQSDQHNFVVLEGRETIGGRSRTVYPFPEGKARDLAVELGSAWLYDNTEPYEQALEQELPLGQVHYDDPTTLGLYAPDGSGEITGKVRQHYSDLWDDYCDYSVRVTEKITEQGRDVPYSQVLEAYLEWRRNDSSNDHNSKTQTKKKKKSKPPLTATDETFLRALVHAQIEIEYAAPAQDVSTQMVGDGVNDCVFCGADYYVPVEGGGFDKLVRKLAAPFLESKIRFRSKVTRIEYDVPLTTTTNSDSSPPPLLGVRVTYTDLETGRSKTLWGKTVLVTVPLGVLKHQMIDFQPPLPVAKQTAIDTIGFGILNKCIFYWDTPQTDWWPTGREVLTLVDDDHNYTTIFNDHELGNGNHFVLSAWIAGDSARTMEFESDDTIAGKVYDHLVQMLARKGDDTTKTIPRPSQVLVTRWGQDEFAYGSYSYSTVPDERHGPPLMEGARRELGLRTGSTLFWAGEATHEKWYGTTVGAYRSGQQVAEDIHFTLLQQQQQQQRSKDGKGFVRRGGKQWTTKHQHRHGHQENTFSNKV